MIPTLLFFALLLCFPSEAAAGVREGLTLALGTAVPALFPFFLASALLLSSGAADRLSRLCTPLTRFLFRLPGAAAPALLLGLTGGYPVGVRTARGLFDRGLLSRADTERLLLCCNNTGPGFLIGLCGSVLLGSTRAGLLLYLVHLISALLVGVLLCRRDAPAPAAPPLPTPPVPLSRRIPEAVSSAGKTALQVVFFITAASCLLRLLRVCRALALLALLLRPLCPLLALPSDAAPAVAQGLLEVTCGLFALPALPPRTLLPAVSLLTSFGGLSVWCQSAAMLAGTGLSAGLRGKILHGILSAGLISLLLRVFPAPQTVFAPLAAPPSSVSLGFFIILSAILLPFISGNSTGNRL